MTPKEEDLPERLSPLYLLHRAGQCAENLFQVEMEALELTPRQFAVLFAVSSNQGSSQTELVEGTGIDRSTMADLVRRLLKRGMLERRRSKNDARAYSVMLTEQGQQALKSAKPIAKRVDERLLGALSEEHAKELVRNLSTIIRAFDRSASLSPE